MFTTTAWLPAHPTKHLQGLFANILSPCAVLLTVPDPCDWAQRLLRLIRRSACYPGEESPHLDPAWM